MSVVEGSKFDATCALNVTVSVGSLPMVELPVTLNDVMFAPPIVAVPDTLVLTTVRVVTPTVPAVVTPRIAFLEIN